MEPKTFKEAVRYINNKYGKTVLQSGHYLEFLMCVERIKKLCEVNNESRIS